MKALLMTITQPPVQSIQATCVNHMLFNACINNLSFLWKNVRTCFQKHDALRKHKNLLYFSPIKWKLRKSQLKKTISRWGNEKRGYVELLKTKQPDDTK